MMTSASPELAQVTDALTMASQMRLHGADPTTHCSPTWAAGCAPSRHQVTLEGLQDGVKLPRKHRDPDTARTSGWPRADISEVSRAEEGRIRCR